MKKVYSSDSFFLIGHLRELLEHHHITCIAKNEFLLGGAGELPPTECWPELWITEDFQYEKARELVEGFLASSPEAGSEWRCPACGEGIEGQFSACWRCGAERPLDSWS
jgi:DNA-directed RNA polymerase subunit RPC12/RpoP